MIRNAAELVQPGENVFIVFIQGTHFIHDENGIGYTGIWIAG